MFCSLSSDRVSKPYVLTVELFIGRVITCATGYSTSTHPSIIKLCVLGVGGGGARTVCLSNTVVTVTKARSS